MPRESVSSDAPRVGFFGKVPTHGDFVSRRLSRAARAAFDGWLSQSVAASRRQLGERWTKIYLVAPVWRFVVATRMLGTHPVAGVLMPSVDRVGRYFPLVLAVELPGRRAATRLFRTADEWFDELEALARSSLDDDFDFDRFDAAVGALAAPVADRKAAGPIIRNGGHDGEAFDVPDAGAEAFSMWWTHGSDAIAASLLTHPGFPAPEQFAALLDGRWQAWGWIPAKQTPRNWHAPSARELESVPFRSAARTHVGTVRARNEDAFVERPDLGLWAVADGAGGHAAGAFASIAVIDKLQTLMTPLSFGGALVEIAELLEEANDLLRARARTLSPHAMVAAVVVVLFIYADRFAVVWAGDSRAYVLRQGILARLTADHRGEGGAHSVRCAVGAEDVLVTEIAYGRLEPGDRFVLCSDGLVGSLDDDHVARAAARGTPAQAAARLIDDALVGGARDNVTVVVVDAVKSQP